MPRTSACNRDNPKYVSWLAVSRKNSSATCPSFKSDATFVEALSVTVSFDSWAAHSQQSASRKNLAQGFLLIADFDATQKVSADSNNEIPLSIPSTGIEGLPSEGPHDGVTSLAPSSAIATFSPDSTLSGAVFVSTSSVFVSIPAGSAGGLELLSGTSPSSAPKLGCSESLAPPVKDLKSSSFSTSLLYDSPSMTAT